MTDVIFERRGKKEDNELELEFRRVCDEENPRGAPLPFSIVLASKQINSCGLQLADLIARPIGKSNSNLSKRTGRTEVLEAKIVRDQSGQIANAGLVCFP